MRRKFTFALLLASTTSLPTVVLAQEGWSGPSDIIVTARKRDETSIAVPVVLTAVSGAELERRGIVKLDDLVRTVPQLQIGAAGGAIQGGQIGIRGIAASADNPFADQAVSFNVDGVQISRANIRRLAEMDLAQIEVLKGPQALFFGKNSPAGIISMRSADPTPDLQVKISAGYEFNAHEWRGDGFVAGPLTETLGARLAVFGSTMRGWAENDVDGASFYRSSPDYTPKTKEWAVRGTLKWEPSDRFDARLKVSYSHSKDFGFPLQERKHCPYGTPQLGGGPDDCKLDGKGVRFNLHPFLGTISDRYPEDGVPFARTKQALVSHEMNYDFSEIISLSSVTGYYYLEQSWADQFNSAWDQNFALPSAGAFGNREFSQELRLSSDYDGPANFLVGGYFQTSKAHNGATTFMGVAPNNGVNPTQLNNYRLTQKGTAYSWFGQVMFEPVDLVEISIGGRYSYEKKRLTSIETMGAPGPGPIPRLPVPENPAFPRKNSWSDFSPEFTVSYRPSSDLTLFASHKHGFLSGGFNSGATNFNSDLSFDQQKIKGWEGGVKAALFNGALRTNLAAYRYVITGMQVSTSVTVQGAAPVQTVINAGKATTKGAEFDFTYRTPLEGLSIHGAVGYNDANYNIFSVGCYNGQSQEEGCNFGAPTIAVIGGVPYSTYAQQNLAGHPIVRAPKWSGNIGASWDHDIGSTLRIGLSGDMTFSSGYDTRETANPEGHQKSWQILDAGLRVGAQDDSWELALIGRNLTNKYYIPGRAFDVALTGSGAGRAANDPRGRVLGDQWGVTNRGREIMLRATIRYGGL